MKKFRSKGKEYWVGHHPKLGYLIFDPLVQNAESVDSVRLYVVDRNKSASFKKDIVKKNLTDNSKLDRGVCERLLRPYAEARNRMRVTHCYRCSENLSTSDFGICDQCGWIQCSCGACGCQYQRS